MWQATPQWLAPLLSWVRVEHPWTQCLVVLGGKAALEISEALMQQAGQLLNTMAALASASPSRPLPWPPVVLCLHVLGALSALHCESCKSTNALTTATLTAALTSLQTTGLQAAPSSLIASGLLVV